MLTLLNWTKPNCCSSLIHIWKKISYQCIKVFYCVLWHGRVRGMWTLGNCSGLKKQKRKSISHILCYLWLHWKGSDADKRVSCEPSLVFTSNRSHALCPQSAKSLACSPLPYGQRWYVHDRKDNILLLPRRAHTVALCLAGTNKGHI